MHPLLAELVAPFDRLPDADAAAVLADRYGLADVSLERLDTERDDTFRVRAGGRDLVLKVAHPQDDPSVVDLQLRALQHAASVDPLLPLQVIVPTVDGEVATEVDGRVARVFEWVDGTLARGGSPTPKQLQASGRMLGRLSLALRGFEHPAADRGLAWDISRLPVLRELPANPATTEILDRFEEKVLPVLEGLPRQVIHNDFHPGNLLVDPGEEAYVTGILDFGDTVRSARVNDLGVALAYLSTGSSPWEAARPFIAGFEEVVPLLPAERAVLPHLVSARLVQRVLLNEMLERDAEQNEAF
ncbi:phosphotransferase [Schumannella luteola]